MVLIPLLTHRRRLLNIFFSFSFFFFRKNTWLYYSQHKGQVFAERGGKFWRPGGGPYLHAWVGSARPQWPSPLQAHLWDVAVLVHWLGLLLALTVLGDFGPQLFHVLQHHVAVSCRRPSRGPGASCGGSWALGCCSWPTGWARGVAACETPPPPASAALPGSSHSWACWGGTCWWQWWWPRSQVTTVSSALLHPLFTFHCLLLWILKVQILN